MRARSASSTRLYVSANVRGAWWGPAGGVTVKTKCLSTSVIERDVSYVYTTNEHTVMAARTYTYTYTHTHLFLEKLLHLC